MPSDEFVFFNPYYDQSFIGFILTFFWRLKAFMSGQLAWQDLASDEVQLLVLIGVSASSALVGAILVLRRMTMLANSLSHTILMGIVLAYFFTLIYGHTGPAHSQASMPILLIASMMTGFFTAFLTEFLTKTVGLQEDASVGLVFTSLFALGVVLVTILTRDAHIGLEAVMGNADALHLDDSFWVYLILVINLLIFVLFYKQFQITTFDARLAAALGISPLFFNYLLMAQVSATTITSFRAVGVVLVLAFMTGPPLTARLFTYRLKTFWMASVGVGVVAAFLGVALTRHLLTEYGMSLSTSGVVVCVIVLLYIAAFSLRACLHRWNHLVLCQF